MSNSWCDFLVIYEDSPSDMGLLRCVLLYQGCRWDEYARKGDTKKKIDIEQYKGIISLGGEGKDQKSEIEWLSRAIGLGRGVLGICQGAQNVIQAVSLEKRPVRRLRKRDEGLTPVLLTDSGKKDAVLGHLKAVKRVCQGHSWEYILPSSPPVNDLARSAPNVPSHSEAFCLHKLVYGLQFHPEVSSTDIPLWVKKKEEVPCRPECVEISRAGWNILNAWVGMVLDPAGSSQSCE